MGITKTFNHGLWGSVRCWKDDRGNVSFLASDVAKGLGYRDSFNMIRNLDDDEKGTQIVSTPGGNQTMTVITESGFYHAALKSRVPQAQAFRRWVTSEVLPQIRQTGGYINLTPNPSPDGEGSLTDADIMARALMIAQKTIELKSQLIEQQKPLVRFAEAVSESEGAILISELAKMLTKNGFEIGRTRLFRWLRKHGYLFQKSTEPLQKWVEKGLFEIKETLIGTNHGDIITVTTKVTGKGQRYFIDGFLSKKFTL